MHKKRKNADTNAKEILCGKDEYCMQKGKASIAFDHPPLICGAASVAGARKVKDH